MYQTINFSQFCDGFSDSYENNFSYEGKRALFDYFEQYEDAEDIEFDPIAICCEWSEYQSLDEVKKEYDDIETLEDLEDKTDVLQLENGGLVIRQF